MHSSCLSDERHRVSHPEEHPSNRRHLCSSLHTGPEHPLSSQESWQVEAHAGALSSEEMQWERSGKTNKRKERQEMSSWSAMASDDGWRCLISDSSEHLAEAPASQIFPWPLCINVSRWCHNIICTKATERIKYFTVIVRYFSLPRVFAFSKKENYLYCTPKIHVTWPLLTEWADPWWHPTGNAGSMNSGRRL